MAATPSPYSPAGEGVGVPDEKDVETVHLESGTTYTTIDGDPNGWTSIDGLMRETTRGVDVYEEVTTTSGTSVRHTRTIPRESISQIIFKYTAP